MKVANLFSIALIPMCVVAFVGCHGTPVPPTVPPPTAYQGGKLQATIAATPQNVIDASTAAANELHMAKVEMRREGDQGFVTAKTVDDRNVTVNVGPLGPKSTSVAITVDGMGDETVSRQLLEKIRSHLPTTEKNGSPL